MQIYSQKYLVHSSFAHNRAKINHKSNNIEEQVAYPKKLVFLQKCQNWAFVLAPNTLLSSIIDPVYSPIISAAYNCL